MFESDAKNLVDTVHGSAGYSYFDSIVEDCKELVKHFKKVLVVFVHRSANNVAHLLAKAAYSVSGCQEWYSIAPEFIACNIDSESF